MANSTETTPWWESEQNWRNQILKEVAEAQDGNALCAKARPKDLIDDDCSPKEILFSRHGYSNWLSNLDEYKEAIIGQCHSNKTISEIVRNRPTYYYWLTFVDCDNDDYKEVLFGQNCINRWYEDKTLVQYLAKVAGAYAIYWQTVVNNLRQKERLGQTNKVNPTTTIRLGQTNEVNQSQAMWWVRGEKRRNLTIKELVEAQDGEELLFRAKPLPLYVDNCSLKEVLFENIEYPDYHRWLSFLDEYKEAIVATDNTLDQYFIKVAEAYALYWQTVGDNLH